MWLILMEMEGNRCFPIFVGNLAEFICSVEFIENAADNVQHYPWITGNSIHIISMKYA